MADLDNTFLTEQIKNAQKHYAFADAQYNKIKESFQLGEADKTAFDEAFETSCRPMLN
jgi:hypothetical protein